MYSPGTSTQNDEIDFNLNLQKLYKQGRQGIECIIEILN
ncbi:hypothetical protein CLL_A2159 [Clostridium botulinum B str. Eklund 17B (NRP)]|uniref:Uncharacterized protein n=1 Tax=Clostridium botulinum (strain Eklund 17B / Type B) TaxID=935198 RepID=B2TPS4_CLOBB|nr:hypothetical protein CLL_A2159 [Clostridium botulinum B str. Eklund 17B (NRP)]